MATKGKPTRPRVALDPKLYLELREKSHAVGVPVSKLVEDAVKYAFDEDAEDVAIIEERRHEPGSPYAVAREDLKRRGKL